MISIKSFIKFLNSHVLSSTTIACELSQAGRRRSLADDFPSTGICEGHCVILYVYIGDFADAGGVLTFYIPAQMDP
jgi:HUS1 checkpoint protein